MGGEISAVRKLNLIIAVMLLFAATACASKYNRGTYDLYLIPKGYEGTIRVIYNVKDAPLLQREEEYDVIPVDRSGKYETSTPMYDYGEVIDRYYYVDAQGKRTEIDPQCVNVRGTGGTDNGTVQTHYTEIEVTRSKCGNDFRLWGSTAR